MNLHENNTTALTVASTGKNPTMKTLERGHGVSIGWINSRVNSGDYNLVHTRTQHMSADIYTKGINNPDTWNRLRKLINVYTPLEISSGDLNPKFIPGEQSEASLAMLQGFNSSRSLE